MSRCILRIGAMALAVFLGSFVAASAQRAPQLPPPIEFEYFYEVPSNRRLQPIYDRLTDKDVLAQLDTYLKPLRLPRKLTLRTRQCGDGRIVADYRSGGDLVLCYEYLERVDTLIKGSKIKTALLADATRDGALAHALLHLVARDIFDQLKVPVWGRMEDAADRLSSYLMMTLGPAKAEDWYGGAGVYFFLSGHAERVSFTDQTSPDLQRFFNHLCFAQIAGDKTYGLLLDAWTHLIMKPAEAAELKKFFDALALPPDQQAVAFKALNLNEGVFASFYFKRIAGYCSKEVGEVKNAFKQELLRYIDTNALTAAQRGKL